MNNRLLPAQCSSLCIAFLLLLLSATTKSQSWTPPGADTSFPRSIIHADEIASVKASLASGTNLDLYADVYDNALTSPPAGNSTMDDKQLRATLAKNAAFVALLNIKPSGTTTAALTLTERNNLITKSLTLLEELNTYVNVLSSDTPQNFDQWQYTSKQMIDYLSAYDLLLGAGVPSSQMALSKSNLKNFVGNLYYEASKITLVTSFFQSTKNNHALMTAGAIGMGAVILNDITDTDAYSPNNWINAAMWNIHNVMWWDIKKQSSIFTKAGYAEGTHYFRYAFCNLLPFFRSMKYYLRDTSIIYQFNGINRKLRHPWYDTNYVKIYDWIEGIRLPDGRLPALEDSYTFGTFPELAIAGNSKYNWPLHLSQLDPLQFNSLTKQLTMIYDLRANYIAANVPVSSFADSLFNVMPDAGIAVFRSSWDSSATYLALTGKNGTTLASTDAHNHADEGSFVMMVNGQTMALLPGYVNYLMRDTVARAKNHNMLLVNDEATLPGFPGKPNGANCYIEKCFSSPVQHYAELRTNYQNTDINRKVVFVRNKYFLMVDHLAADSNKRYSYTLHGYGLEGGDNVNTGTFTDLFANNRAAWQRRNSGLYAIVNSDAPLSFTKQTNVHEYKFAVVQNHTSIKATTDSSHAACFVTCLQPYTQLGTDTFPVLKLNIPNTVTYKVTDNDYIDLLVSQSTNNALTIDAATTGLNHSYTTDAKAFWTSEKSGVIQDLFMYKGHVLKKEDEMLISSFNLINIQYIQTGAKTFTGFCGDTGWVDFHTGEFPSVVEGEGIWYMNYDSATKIASIYFHQATTFNIVLDDSKLGINELFTGKSYMKVSPNPATDRIQLEFDELITKGTHLVMYDLMGNTVLEQVIDQTTKQYTAEVNALKPGIYFARLTNGSSHTFPVKIMIVR